MKTSLTAHVSLPTLARPPEPTPSPEHKPAAFEAVEKPAHKAQNALARPKSELPPEKKVGNVLAVLTGKAETQTRFAAIDLGSSSAKMLVLERTNSGWKTLLDKKIGCALGKGVSPGQDIPDANAQRAIDALSTFAKDAEALGVPVKSIPVITTAVVRNATNGQAVADRIEKEAGLSDIRILTGEEESQHGFLGALTMMGGAPGKYATLDLGGGSFQLAVGTEKGFEDGGSTQIGSNQVLDTIFKNKELLDASDFDNADKTLAQTAPMPLDPDLLDGRTLIATGGISKFLRAHFGSDVISAKEIDALRREVAKLSYDARIPIVQNGKDDETKIALGVDTEQGAKDYGIKLTASSTLLLHILRGIGVDSVRVSETDVRHLLVARQGVTTSGTL